MHTSIFDLFDLTALTFDLEIWDMAEEVTFLHGNNIYQNQFDILTVKWLKMGNGRL